MATVSEQVVESTWRRVGSMAPASARHSMESAGNRQPELLAYVLASVSESRRTVQELGVYVYHVFLQMFESAARVRVKRVSQADVEQHASRNETLLLDLQSTHPRLMERVGRVEVSRQPHVMRYVCDALFEQAEPDSDIKLTDDESGLLFLALKTVVDALDEVDAAEGEGPA